MFSRIVGNDGAVLEILGRRRRIAPSRAVLVGVSGIDGSGKGYVTARLVSDLRLLGWKAVGINVDGWLNLPSRRFDDHAPAENFYQNALRLDEMFSRLILPLKKDRSIALRADFAEETATEFRPHLYEYSDVDIVVLEGIQIFKRAYRDLFDLALWVDCSFETALERAVRRAQEGLPPQDTIRAYQRIYFPAQRIHFDRDDPRGQADLIIENDPRLAGCGKPVRRREPTGCRAVC